ncbi:hypothetical protein ACFL1B_06270 [Nanoarchaeota archaeon]
MTVSQLVQDKVKVSQLSVGVVLLDMQPGVLYAGHNRRKLHRRGPCVYENIPALIQAQMEVLDDCIENDIPVLLIEGVVERDSGLDYVFGETIEPLRSKLELVKRAVSGTKSTDCGYHPKAAEWFVEQAVNALFFMGVTGNGCVRFTVEGFRDGRSHWTDDSDEYAGRFALFTNDKVIADCQHTPRFSLDWYKDAGMYAPDFKMLLK